MSGPSRQEILRMRPRELARVLAAGHDIDPAALEGWEYRGISLGLPRIAERLTWKTFQKTFRRDPATGQLGGWNVRVEQRGVDAESVPRTRRGVPVTFGPYRVVPLLGARPPRPCPRGLLIHYGLACSPLHPMARVRDPITALDEGSADRLLGWTYLDLGLASIPTPIFFLLERERPLGHVC